MSSFRDRLNGASPARGARNALLNALREEDWLLLRPHLEPHAFTRGQTLFRQGEHVDHATFPCERLVLSLRVTSAEGLACETASIGREGAIGGIVSQGDAPAFATATAQTNGAAWRIATTRLDELKTQSPALRHLFARYADALLAQVMQTAACNALHEADQRIANWLLAFQERVGGDDAPVTQDDVAVALGVGRPYASRRLNDMQARGWVRLRRGAIRICARAELQRASCGCHRAVRKHYEAAMGGLYPPAQERP